MVTAMVIAGTCAWTPIGAAMSIVPDAMTPAAELTAVVDEASPASLPTQSEGPLLCESAFDPRCAVSPGTPQQARSTKHAPDLVWVARVPAYARAAVKIAHAYAGRALAGFMPRVERPPRCA